MKAPTAASDQWTCGACGCKTAADKTQCAVCETDRPGAAAKPAAPAQPPVHSTPQAFDWAAAGLKAPTAAADQWTCGACGCKTAADKAQCSVCEADRPAAAAKPARSPHLGWAALPGSSPAPEAAPRVFDWAAAGMKAPVAAGDQWTCGACGCKTAAEKTKCAVCDADRA
jgi:hypothetical protein